LVNGQLGWASGPARELNVGIRFITWVGVALALSAVTAPSFPSLVNQSVGDAFGGLFVAIPIVALLTAIFAMKWKEFAGAMNGKLEGTSLPLRVIGMSLVGGLVVAEPLTGQTLATSGVAVVLTFYGSSLIIIPSAWRFILPYAGVYAAAVGAPAALLWALGEPLSVVSSGLSEKLAGLAGLPVFWQGTQFEILSKSGEVVNGVVTPSCSSITSVTMFVGLLALMHLDMRSRWRPTVKLAVAGVLILTILDSIRILVLLWVGYEYGAGTMWGVHDWIGYAMFLGFFLAALPVYFRMSGPTLGTNPSPKGPMFHESPLGN
jgi:exosortase/archaeosortase family protein